MLPILQLYSFDERTISECRPGGGMRIDKGNWSNWRKSGPLPLCKLQDNRHVEKVGIADVEKCD
jgi:hypothetical protein